ncbi:heptosyltransferase [Leptospira kobayashii]|uniref:Heptosyltransferase n=1 Tax=Leptospira kobayashii TaxID=1917830 RepID=A0ABM7URN8_9LEPT|nr:glycosyltransferase family 9 protein [Leptospira kobayashii]BDA78060.1 heptosyltransferase [Leptospira kobayashii]
MNLLVLRFSAMGDVALMTPALIAIAAKYSNAQITVVTRGNFSPFFYNIPNVNVLGINLKKYKGFFGIIKLYREIAKLGPFHAVVDLHGSVRSRMIAFFFRWQGIPTSKIIKGRREKLQQTRRFNKKTNPLPHTVDRYLNVFKKVGFDAPIRKGPWLNVDGESKMFAKDYFKSIGLEKKSGQWFGFAPFAGHALKEWPFPKSKKLTEILLEEFPDCHVFLFGSKDEGEQLETLKAGSSRINLVQGGNLGIRGELGIMERLDLMIGMDSSNVHIAALLKKPVIGLYGTTHPMSGFGPFAQEDSGVLQVDLACRPCSIYGNTKCWRGDFACMEMIDPFDVVRRIRFLQNVNTLW